MTLLNKVTYNVYLYLNRTSKLRYMCVYPDLCNCLQISVKFVYALVSSVMQFHWTFLIIGYESVRLIMIRMILIITILIRIFDTFVFSGGSINFEKRGEGG